MSFSFVPTDQKRTPDDFLPGTACTAADFVFKNGVFYANFQGHLHPRKNAVELHDHLSYTPSLPITDTSLPVHQTTYSHYKAHFYSAQLLHYGLKPLKTIRPAQRKLFAAFGGRKTLEVPQAILDLEEELREQWRRSNPAVKAEEKGESKTRDSKPPVIDAVATIKQRSGTEVIAPSFAGSKPLHLNPVPAMSVIKGGLQLAAPAPIAGPSGMPRTKQTARKTTTGFQTSSINPKSMEDRDPSPPRYRTKQTARRGSGRLASVIPRERVKKLRKEETKPVMTKAEIRAVIKSMRLPQTRKVLIALLDKLPAGQDIISKELMSTKDDSAKPTRVDPSEWTGMYDIEAPSIEGECEEHIGHFTFEVYTSSTSSHLWAEFDFGVVAGVMRSVHPPPIFFDTNVYFEWRGRTSEGMMTYGCQNRAIITFLPDGLLEGKVCGEHHKTFKIYGSIQVYRNFAKVTRKSEEQQKAEVKSWKATWRHLNDNNYEVERIARWGKRGGDTKEEQAFESDTTAGRKKRTWKLDIAKFMKDPDTDSDISNHSLDGSEEEDW